MNYLNNWAPARYIYLRDKNLENEIYERGYAVPAQLTSEQLKSLLNLYSGTHTFTDKDGGMFYSVYSGDIAYRRKVHMEVFDLLKPVYDSLFVNYKSVINSFIVKVSGPKSEFYLHQDSTGLDEFKYSVLSVWIPLQDTNLKNGCMCVLPKSHSMFSPLRGISLTPPFDKIQDRLLKYLQPIELKAGDVLLFDNRLVHNSVENSSGKDRVVVMSGIFPVEANIINCFKDSSGGNDEIELIEQEDDYLVEYPKFLNGCFDRPNTGRLLGKMKDIYRAMDGTEFEALCAARGIKAVNAVETLKGDDCKMIGEPVNGTHPGMVRANDSILSKVKGFFV